MKKHFSLLLISILFLQLKSTAQLFEAQRKYTEADTLRGTLNEMRSCYDVTFYRLNIRVSPNDSLIDGMCAITFKAVTNTKRIQVDLFSNLDVLQILYQNKTLHYERKFNAIFIDFPVELKQGTINNVTVAYHGKPTVAKFAPWDGGLIWKKTKDGKPWVGVACQGFGASCWWPCKDSQSDEPDSMAISITCPSDLMNVSNGRLRNKKDYGNGWTQYDWFVNNPINNYDVTLNIANYEHFSDTLGKLTLDYYVLPENIDKAKEQFKQVKPMLQCYEKMFGPYPFYEDGYKLVETHYLGMEHQSAVAYGNKYKNGYLGRSLSSDKEVGMKFDYIIIHESSHEWFGNSITTADIADMWVHEGFGQYAEALYLECMYGKADYLKYINGLKTSVGNNSPIIGPYGVNEEGSGDMYAKGALTIHTIRTIINNDEKFFAILKGMCKDFYHTIVTSKQIENYWSEKSGINLHKTFEQYLYYKDLPTIEFKLENNQVMMRWNCDVKNFDMPLTVIIKGDEKRLLHPTDNWQVVEGIVNTEDVKVDKELMYVRVNRL